jgi:hypothetical protein
MVNGVKTDMVNDRLLSRAFCSFSPPRGEKVGMRGRCRESEHRRRSDALSPHPGSSESRQRPLTRIASLTLAITTPPRAAGRGDNKFPVLAARFVGARVLSNSERRASQARQGGGGAPKGAWVVAALAHQAERRLRCACRGARRFWRTRSPSGALPRLSPEASRPKAQSGPALHGRGQPIRAPGSQLLADRRLAGRASFRTAREWSYEPHPGHRPRSHQSAVTG